MSSADNLQKSLAHMSGDENGQTGLKRFFQVITNTVNFEKQHEKGHIDVAARAMSTISYGLRVGT